MADGDYLPAGGERLEDLEADMEGGSEEVLSGESGDEYDDNALAAMPLAVREFLAEFYAAVKSRDTYAIHVLYEREWPRLTSEYFDNSEWPRAEAIAQLVDNDFVFLALYKELYYRHIYAKLQPSVDHRYGSWENFVELFRFLLNSAEAQQVVLPDHWLWDLVDEFVYQFQNFYNYRSKLKTRNSEEVQILRAHPELWAVQSVLRFLHELAARSSLVARLARERGCELPGAARGGVDFSSSTLHQRLGYYALVGLARVHCLFGDYRAALNILSPLDLSKRGLFSEVLACHISTYYYAGFAYMMLRRYVDAVRSFSLVLLHAAEHGGSSFKHQTSHHSQHSHAYQYDEVHKKSEQMYALLAICMVLCPQRLDHAVASALREKQGDKMLRMASRGGGSGNGSTSGGREGDLKTFEELFMFGCPKFIVPSMPRFDGAGDAPVGARGSGTEALRWHCRCFMWEVRQQIEIPTIRSFLQLYTSIPVSKLDDFLDLSRSEDVVSQLLCCRHKMTQRVWTGGAPLIGSVASVTQEPQFYLDGDMVVIGGAGVSSAAPSLDYFVDHVNKFVGIAAKADAVLARRARGRDSSRR